MTHLQKFELLDENKEEFTSITIPEGVTSIDVRAFRGYGKLTSVTIPGSVKTIESFAFRGCHSLTSITIPHSVTKISECAFLGCNSLIAINVDSTNKKYSSDAQGVLYDKKKTILIRCGGGVQGTITIPDSVKTINGFAFEDCKGLSSISIPDGVTEIGSSAFAYCKGLTSINIPNSVKKIGGFAFADCDGLTTINVDADNTKYRSVDGVLYNKNRTTLIWCSKKKNSVFLIPNSVTEIGICAFKNCSGLTSINIPKSVTKISEWAFEDCEGLTTINVDADNRNYRSVDGVLYNKNITTLIKYPDGKTGEFIIPDSVTIIGNWAFRCKKLTSITIPNSVIEIGYGAFEDCKSLTSITNFATTPQRINFSAFENVNNVTLYVPAESVKAYKAASGWKDLKNIQPISNK